MLTLAVAPGQTEPGLRTFSRTLHKIRRYLMLVVVIVDIEGIGGWLALTLTSI
jgi:hypothetical protein